MQREGAKILSQSGKSNGVTLDSKSSVRPFVEPSHGGVECCVCWQAPC